MKKILCMLSFAVMFCGTLSSADFEAERGSRVAWARLKFPVRGDSASESLWDWQAHPGGDLRLIRFMRNFTPVNMAEDWNVAEITKLDTMCAFPLLFIHAQRREKLGEAGRRNLREYILRGGFIFVDDCVWDNHAPDQFYRSFIQMLTEILPGVRFERVNPGHELFNCCFQISSFPHCQGANNGLSLIYYQEQLIGAITSSDLHCGWVGWFGQKSEESMKLASNIYIYAMTH